MDNAERRQSEKMIQQMVVFAEEMIGTGKEQVTYKKILENLLYISGAKYAVFNLLDEKTGIYTTVAVAGIGDIFTADTEAFGFELIGKQWKDYHSKSEMLQNNTITRFPSVIECAGSVIPDIVTGSLDNIFGLGEVAVAKIMINNIMFGDFTLIMPQGQELKNAGLVEIYSRQINLYLARIKADESLVKSEERYRNIFNQSPIAIEIFDFNGHLISVNEACIQLFGVIHREEVIGFNLFSDPNVTDEVKRKLLEGESVKIHSIFDFEEVKRLGLYATTRSGCIDLDLSITSLRNDQKVEGYIVQTLDISERKSLEAALIEIKANQIKSNFLSVMSHELRTPLNPVIVLSGVLSRNLNGIISQEQQNYLEVIERSGKKLLTMINEILDISRVESGHVGFDIAAFELNSLVMDIVAMLQPVAQLKKIDILHENADKEIWVTSDKQKLGHILQNIVDNAVKFTGKGSVRVRCMIENDIASISISDTGIGIDQKHLSQIFEKFKQADSSITRKYGGTGLGLAISKSYAEMLGGSIDVQSTPGSGSIFTVSIPLKFTSRIK